METRIQQISLAKKEREFFEAEWKKQSLALEKEIIPFQVVKYMNYLAQRMDRETDVIDKIRGRNGAK